MRRHLRYRYTYIILWAFIAVLTVFGRSEAIAAPKGLSRNVVGVVKDADTGERLSFVNVQSKHPRKGVTTDAHGVFRISVPIGTVLNVNSLGYAPMDLKTKAGNDTLFFLLKPQDFTLQEVVIKPKKKKYSKKNNPAVDLMRKVRAHRKEHDPVANSNEYSYDRYDKMLIALDDYKGYMNMEFVDSLGNVHKIKPKGKRQQLFSSLVDTGLWSGKRIMDLSLKEKMATRITSKHGGLDKEVVVAQKSDGFDKSFDDNYTRLFFEDALREIDVYSNDISVMRNSFVSPLSAIGADYYMYHIEDTVLVGNEPCVELSFAPHNAQSLGFNGKLFIPVNDSVKYVKRVMMRVPKASNINYVKDLWLSQNFTIDSLGHTHKVLDDMVVELQIIKGTQGLHLSRMSRYDNFSYNKRDDMKEYYDRVGNLFVIDEADDQDGEFWQQHRMVPLTYAETQLDGVGSPFRKIPVLYWLEKGVELVIKGYVRTGKKSKFDFGPIDTFISYNATEGLRLAVGGLTTANLSKNLFGRGYVAYGFHDRKWKYSGELEYSFVDKKYHSREFPMNGIRATYRYDIYKLGQHYLSNAANNLLNSIKRLDSNLSTYQRLAKLEYNIEWRNNLSFHAEAKYERQEATQFVPFVNGYGVAMPHYNTNTLKMTVRYAPGEKFMQTYNERRMINRDALTLQFSHEFGPKGLFGSAFTVNVTEFLLQKRWWMSVAGYADVIFRAGKIWNQVQFPALLWQNANTAFTMQSETYALLNPMEHALDEYVSLDLNYNLNGLIFNRIPWLNKLRLREVVSFKGYWGHLTKKNNPEDNPELFRFPDPNTKPMGKTPYMEIGIGIDNILTFLRLDYVWRLSYRDTPGAPNSGLRFSFHFSF